MELTGLREPEPPNEAMLRGSALEAAGRDQYIVYTGVIVKPAVFISDTYPWAMASMDGICDNNHTAIEIKCGKRSFADFKKGKPVPNYYYAQMQHQMFVCDLTHIVYCCYDGKELLLREVSRNQDFIDKMVKAELAFYYDWQNLKPPTIEEAAWNAPYGEYVKQCDEICAKEEEC